MPATVGALRTQLFSGRAPWLADTPHPTVSCGTPPVSLTSAWQEAILGREGRSENNHQAGPPEHNPMPCHRRLRRSHPLHSAAAFLFDTIRHRETQSFLSFRGCARLSEWVLEPPHLSCGEEKTIPSLEKKMSQLFQQLLQKKSPLWRIWRNPRQPKCMPGKDPENPSLV